MSKSIYELHKILGKYCAYETDHVSNIDTCGEIHSYPSREFEGSFDANIYHFGELADIELNGWTFGCRFEGTFHEPGSYYNTSFEIECIDPYDTELRLYSTPYKIRFSKENVIHQRRIYLTKSMWTPHNLRDMIESNDIIMQQTVGRSACSRRMASISGVEVMIQTN